MLPIITTSQNAVKHMIEISAVPYQKKQPQRTHWFCLNGCVWEVSDLVMYLRQLPKRRNGVHVPSVGGPEAVELDGAGLES